MYIKKDWFKENNIDKEAHYFVLLHPQEYMITPWGIIGGWTSSQSRKKWVECKIIDQEPPYGKVTLQPIEEGYGKEHYYKSDFISGLKSGWIIKKENNMHCEEITFATPLCGSVYIVTRAYVVV